MCSACYGSGGAACIECHWLLPTLAAHALEYTPGHVQRDGDEATAMLEYIDGGLRWGPAPRASAMRPGGVTPGCLDVGTQHSRC